MLRYQTFGYHLSEGMLLLTVIVTIYIFFSNYTALRNYQGHPPHAMPLYTRQIEDHVCPYDILILVEKHKFWVKK